MTAFKTLTFLKKSPPIYFIKQYKDNPSNELTLLFFLID